ncbi:MAG: helix-turn-helix transcriptional regulator [Actinomycetota bacterium]|nr:helix-turn-helix transcriptional regulator [Actinomycetota bacterium]
MVPGVEAHASMPLYVISVAAELSGLHPQTLRQYDRLGLVSPGRSPGRGRRYSAEDIATLREVQRLTAEGVNLAGVKRILELEGAVRQLHARLRALQSELRTGDRAGDESKEATAIWEQAVRPANLPVPLPVRASTAVVVWRSRR